MIRYFIVGRAGKFQIIDLGVPEFHFRWNQYFSPSRNPIPSYLNTTNITIAIPIMVNGILKNARPLDDRPPYTGERNMVTCYVHQPYEVIETVSLPIW